MWWVPAVRANRPYSNCLKEEELSAGSIQVGNVLLEQLKDRHLYMVRRQVGIVRQEDLLLPYLTVAKNVDYALQVRHSPQAASEKTISTATGDVSSRITILKSFPWDSAKK